MTKYKIKTEQEFINEFGEDWRDEIIGGWNNEGLMDYLFGSELPKYTFEDIPLGWFEKYIKDPYFRLKIKTENVSFTYHWWLSLDMLKEIKVINYNEKKTLVYD